MTRRTTATSTADPGMERMKNSPSSWATVPYSRVVSARATNTVARMLMALATSPAMASGPAWTRPPTKVSRGGSPSSGSGTMPTPGVLASEPIIDSSADWRSSKSTDHEPVGWPTGSLPGGLSVMPHPDGP